MDQIRVEKQQVYDLQVQAPRALTKPEIAASRREDAKPRNGFLRTDEDRDVGPEPNVRTLSPTMLAVSSSCGLRCIVWAPAGTASASAASAPSAADNHVVVAAGLTGKAAGEAAVASWDFVRIAGTRDLLPKLAWSVIRLVGP